MDTTPHSMPTFEIVIEDSIESIFDALKEAILAHKEGQTVSINFSNIRARGDIISSIQKPSQGVVAFLKLFSQSLSIIKSKRTKESSNRAILRVDHPDILEFLSYESELAIKIQVTEPFMKAVENGAIYDLIDPHTNEKTNELDAHRVYELMTDKTSHGEPCILYPQEMRKPTATPIQEENQKSLPFHQTAKGKAHEVIPPPIVNMT